VSGHQRGLAVTETGAEQGSCLSCSYHGYRISVLELGGILISGHPFTACRFVDFIGPGVGQEFLEGKTHPPVNNRGVLNYNLEWGA